MFQIAIYGKGGIGKSTISANLSYLLAKKGHKTMQIGCDPKHDSTRLLLGGKAQKTVLQYVRETPFSERKLEDVLVKGDMGVLCAEAGGPEPGIGCAGRGILTTFDELRRLGSDAVNVDVKIYDVLGDVVCGGFAVPLREGYADGVLIVTSGEFMSMYAANNILKGLKNFDTGSPRVIGLVLNCRGMEGESETVNKFAKAVGMKVVASINRDSLFADAESEGRTLASLFQDSVPFHRLDAMADYVISVIENKTPLSNPIPLDDDQLSDLAAGRPIRKKTMFF